MSDPVGKAHKENFKNFFSQTPAGGGEADSYEKLVEKIWDTINDGLKEEVLRLMQNSSEKRAENSHPNSEVLTSSTANAASRVSAESSKEDLVLEIQKQLTNLQECGQRLKFYVEEMINAYPSED